MKKIINYVSVSVLVFISLFSLTQSAHAQTPSKTFTLTSQKVNETWQKATRNSVSWTSTGFQTGATITITLASINGTSTPDFVLARNVNVKKGELKVALSKLDRAPLGSYHVKVIIPGTAGNASGILAVSTGIVVVTKPAAPFIRITSPQAGTVWENTSQRITWITNFVRVQVKGKNANAYAGIRVVPTYGIGTDAHSLDLTKFSQADRNILLKMAPPDLVAFSRLTDQQKESLDSITPDVPGLSPIGISQLKQMSLPGMDLARDIDTLGIAEFALDGALKPIQLLESIDPVMKAHAMIDPMRIALGGLFGDEDADVPEKVNVIIEALPEHGNPIRLNKTYLEKARQTVSLKKLLPGKYRIRLTAKLPKKVLDKYVESDLTVESGVFTVVKKQPAQPAKKGNTSAVINATSATGFGSPFFWNNLKEALGF